MKKIILLVGIVMILISGCNEVTESIHYRGELCEEVNFDDFNYDMTNITGRIRAERLWNEYTTENQIKGYCKDGKRIGGVW